MPSIDYYDPPRRQMIFNQWKIVRYCFGTPTRFLYASMRTALLYESEESKLEIFRQVDKYLHCSVRTNFQQNYQKVVKTIEPTAPDHVYPQCEIPKLLAV